MSCHHFQTIKSNLQALNDDSIPLELAMKPFVMYDEGLVAMQELTSTQTAIVTLINDDGDRSQSDTMKELKTHVERYENVLANTGRDLQKDNKFVRL